jgi:hypothetical protein
MARHGIVRAALAPGLLGSLLAAALGAALPAIASDGVHTTYLWHMHQPIYWPDRSAWQPTRYETAYETITLGHAENDVFAIFDTDDRVAAYQWSPRDAVQMLLDLPEAGAQVSYGGALVENVTSLAQAGWNGGRYAPDWYAPYRQARGWTTSAGEPRLEPVQVGAHHAISPLMDADAVAMDLAVNQTFHDDAWGDQDLSRGFFPAEMCFSPRLIPRLVEAGIDWALVPDIHLARACADYPYDATEDNCDPPNRADQLNPPQPRYTSHFISRGVTVKVPYPFAFTPQRARHCDPATGEVHEIVVVPTAMAMSWEDGAAFMGTEHVDAIAPYNDPDRPMLVVLAHDGDNHWGGGWSYYHEAVTRFSHAAAAQGHVPSTVATYLADHPVPADAVVHVEDGGWVNADGDFGSPQFINWNWPLVGPSGQFDIPGGWAEDQRNWAVLTAAQNVVETAQQVHGATPDPERVANPVMPGTTPVERAWHFLLAGYESGYMYYGQSLDMELKATLACNEAVSEAGPVAAQGPDLTAPAIWLPQRLPWNPGGHGGGALWGYPSGDGLPLGRDFHVYTFVHDTGDLARVELMVRRDLDGTNALATWDNETYAGGGEVGPWQAIPMTRRDFPRGEPWEMPGIDFPELPAVIADQFWVHLDGYREELLDYYVEAEDTAGNVARSPIQHVWVGDGAGAPPDAFTMDGEVDAGVPAVAVGDGATLWATVREGSLYLATEAAGAAAGADRFVLVHAAGAGGATGAPWAKAGTVIPWAGFLAAEADNGWSGWFDAAEAVQDDPAWQTAHGTVLEGTVPLDHLFPGGAPDQLRLAAAAYATVDGGALRHQAPAGDGDGDLAAGEYASLDVATAAQGAPRPLRLRLAPNPFNPAVTVRLELATPRPELRVEVCDVRGRRVRLLRVGAPAGEVVLRWDGRDARGRACPSGTYLFRAHAAGVQAVARGTLVR